MKILENWKHKILSVVAAGALVVGILPGVSFAKGLTSSKETKVEMTQGVGQDILNQANYFGDEAPSTKVTVDIVLKIHNKSQLATYINQTVSPSSHFYHHYLSVDQFARYFAPSTYTVKSITDYLKSFGIKSKVYQDHLVITATGTVAQFNKAFSVNIEKAGYKGKVFHATRRAPKAPEYIADQILCILGLSDYSSLVSNTDTRPKDLSSLIGPKSASGLPNQTPKELSKRYNLQPLYDEGATGLGQTMGIVSFANFDKQDAYTYWKDMGINILQNRMTTINVDGGANNDMGEEGKVETTLDVEQSGAVAPEAKINTYLAPASDTGYP